MAKRRGTDKQEVEDESLPYLMGVGSLHNVSDKPEKANKRQIGFIRSKTSTTKTAPGRKRNKAK